MQGFWGYEAEDIPGSTGALLSPGQRFQEGLKISFEKINFKQEHVALVLIPFLVAPIYISISSFGK